MSRQTPLSHVQITPRQLNSSVVAIPVVSLDANGDIGSPGGGSTQVSIKEMLTSSGASVMDSTEGAIKVNVVAGAAGGSTEVTVRQSTAADLAVSAVQGSTVWAVQIPTSQSIQVKNSTIGDLLASVQQNSTVWFAQSVIRDSSGVAYPGITTRPTTAVMGLPVRTVLNDLQSTCFSTIGNGSTSDTVVSSVAAQSVKVYAYSITSTAQAINSLSFASSLANPIWTVQMQAVSSAITGANLAVTPPAWLFKTAAGEPLVFKIGPNTGSYHLSFSYFIEA